MTPEEQTPSEQEQEVKPTDEVASEQEHATDGEPSGSQEAPAGYIEEDRYKEAQAWGTQAAQEAAQLRRIIDLAREGDADALDYLGWAPPEQEEELLTPEEELAQRVAQLEAERAQEQEFFQQQQEDAEFEQAEQEFYRTELNRLKLGSADEKYQNMVVGVAQSFLDEDGLPDLEAAHKALQEYTENEFKSRVKAKRSFPQAPSGASPIDNPDLDDDEQRREYLVQKAMERAEEE